MENSPLYQQFVEAFGPEELMHLVHRVGRGRTESYRDQLDSPEAQALAVECLLLNRRPSGPLDDTGN